MSAQVVVPWRGGCPHRERVLGWAQGRYPWPVILARGPEPWCKGAAVNPWVAEIDGVVVVADADVWCDGLSQAVEAVEGGAPWAIPHGDVHRLTQEATEAVLAGADWRGQPLEQAPYRGIRGGGYVVARAEVLREIPLDPRFTGWGQEDVSWGLALATLLGEPWRGEADLVHLWHPPQERMTRKYGSMEGRALYRRYARASHDPAEMQALIGEARDAFPTSQPPSLAGRP